MGTPYTHRQITKAGHVRVAPKTLGTPGESLLKSGHSRFGKKKRDEWKPPYTNRQITKAGHMRVPNKKFSGHRIISSEIGAVPVGGKKTGRTDKLRTSFKKLKLGEFKSMSLCRRETFNDISRPSTTRRLPWRDATYSVFLKVNGLRNSTFCRSPYYLHYSRHETYRPSIVHQLI